MDDQQFWDAVFICLCAFVAHPGNGRGDSPAVTLAHCARLADEALEIRRLRWAE